MKNLKMVLVAVALVFVGITNAQAASLGGEETLIEEIRQAADSFQVAMEIRNYKVAHEQLDVLFPLMKRELKVVKKRIGELQKSGGEVAAKQMQKDYDRKEEIMNLLASIESSSNVALRVKSDDMKALVNEYVDLLIEEEHLVALNK